jgi:hypothetical protein
MAEPPAASPSLPFTKLTANIVDELGGVALVRTHQVCGLDLCLNGAITDAGEVTVAASGASLITAPAFKYGMGIEYAQFAVPLAGGPTHALATLATVRLPPLGTGSALLPGAAARSGEVELRLASDAEITIDKLVFEDDDQRAFRAALIPSGLSLPAVDTTLELGLLVALTPPGATLCPPAQLLVPNREDWAPGSLVEVLAHGVKLDQHIAPYGGWAKVSDAHVSPDGTQIVTDAAGGLPLLTVVGFRLR